MAAAVAVRTGDSTSTGRAPRPRVAPRPVLPSGRAIVGGLLLAVAAVTTFTTWQHAAGTPDTSYAVARRALQPGERLTADDLRLVPAELASGSASHAFAAQDDVIGRVALAPIGEDELIQHSQVSDAGATVPLVEVSFALPRDRAVDGRLRSGDRVDVFVTYDDQTAEVVQEALVVGVGGTETPSFGGDVPLTVTIALDDRRHRAELVHAVRAGEVTLVRSTHAASGSNGGPGDDTQGAEGTDDAGGDVFQPDAPAVGG